MVAGNLEAVARFVTAERAALSDLGLQRHTREVPALRDYLANKAQEGHE